MHARSYAGPKRWKPRRRPCVAPSDGPEMTYERDYILRMVREFATFLARIVRSKNGGQEERTIADLDQAARTFVGLGLDVLEALPVEQLTMMLSIGGSLDVNRA